MPTPLAVAEHALSQQGRLPEAFETREVGATDGPGEGGFIVDAANARARPARQT